MELDHLRTVVAFLEQAVFRRWPRSCSAVGFKIFYYHACQAPHSAVWDYLRADRNIRAADTCFGERNADILFLWRVAIKFKSITERRPMQQPAVTGLAAVAGQSSRPGFL